MAVYVVPADKDEAGVRVAVEPETLTVALTLKDAPAAFSVKVEVLTVAAARVRLNVTVSTVLTGTVVPVGAADVTASGDCAVVNVQE